MGLYFSYWFFLGVEHGLERDAKEDAEHPPYI